MIWESKVITPDNIKKSQAKHILKLIQEMTRAEILARLGPFKFPEYADWYMVSLKKREELLEYIFGTSCLVELGYHWDILKKKKSSRKRIKMKKRKKKKI